MNVEGYSVHANVAVRARDRKRLETLCQYAARPPLAHDRLEQWPGGKLAYRMKAPWRDGTTHVMFDPGELLEKLAALVPRPRYHTIHFYGVLAPAAKWRPQIVPAPPEPKTCRHEQDKPKQKNYRWAELLARTFAVDVLQCPRCGGGMTIVAAIESPEVAGKILKSLGMTCRPPPLSPARRSRQIEVDF